MKLVINGYDVEIKAKACGRRTWDEETAKSVLNKLLLALELASDDNDAGLAWIDRMGRDIEKALIDSGYYRY